MRHWRDEPSTRLLVLACLWGAAGLVALWTIVDFFRLVLGLGCGP